MAALCNGADAIYLGAAAFGARASAGFSHQELRQVIDLYHFYGRRVYVTVNTLVKQRELDGVRDTLRSCPICAPTRCWCRIWACLA